jgi:hypothetical protein
MYHAAGVMDFKGDIKKAKWLSAYEDWNVNIGCETGTAYCSQSLVWVLSAVSLASSAHVLDKGDVSHRWSRLVWVQGYLRRVAGKGCTRFWHKGTFFMPGVEFLASMY